MKNERVIENIKHQLKIISEIVEKNPNSIVGENHEDSKFNKGINIMLKRD